MTTTLATLTIPDVDPLRSFVRDLTVRRRSPRTIQNYCEAAAQLAEHAGTDDLTTVTRDDVESYLLTVLTEHSPGTAANRFRSLRALFNWALSEELIDGSPMAKMHMPAVGGKLTPVLDTDRLRALLGT